MTTPVTTKTANKEIRTEASRWAERLMDTDITHAERMEFQRWLIASESHQQEFRAHNLILNLARDFSEADRNEMLSVATQDVNEQRSQRKVWLSALAASLVLAVGLAVWVGQRYEPATIAYVTVPGMTSDVKLPDGSVAHLNTRTNVRWIGRSGERRVALLEGEALFEVKHDPTKPFTVVLDHSEIRVLGTHFNVRRRDSAEVVVTVLEGTVRVSEAANNTRSTWTRTLHANEQLVYNNAGIVRDVYAASQANAAKWREGILEFDDEPLSTIVEDFSRYTDRRIVIRDPRVAQLRLGGQLNIRDEPKAALGLLEKLAPVAVRESGDTFVLDYRQNVLGRARDAHTDTAP